MSWRGREIAGSAGSERGNDSKDGELVCYRRGILWENATNIIDVECNLNRRGIT